MNLQLVSSSSIKESGYTVYLSSPEAKLQSTFLGDRKSTSLIGPIILLDMTDIYVRKHTRLPHPAKTARWACSWDETSL